MRDIREIVNSDTTRTRAMLAKHIAGSRLYAEEKAYDATALPYLKYLDII